MDHFVKVDRLPEDFVIPPQFQGRLEYDAQAQKLIYHGYMSKTEFDQLSSLTKDWRFRRTFEELFILCTPEAKAPPSGLSRVLAAFGQLFSKK